MIEVFILIGWIDGHRSGGVVSQEFFSLATCEAAKTRYVERHNIQPKDDRWKVDGSWVECVKK
jgi:hypothetical protein